MATGTVGTTNCSTSANDNSGCTVSGGDAGDVFNANGGGIYIMAFEVSGSLAFSSLQQWS
jgi:hypothetical protein